MLLILFPLSFLGDKNLLNKVEIRHLSARIARFSEYVKREEALLNDLFSGVHVIVGQGLYLSSRITESTRVVVRINRNLQKVDLSFLAKRCDISFDKRFLRLSKCANRKLTSPLV